MAGPESQTTINPWVTIPLPGGVGFNPAGLFDATPNNMFITTGQQPENRFSTPQEAAQSIISTMQIPGRPTAGTVFTPRSTNAATPSPSDLLVGLMQAGFSQEAAEALIFTDPIGAYELWQQSIGNDVSGGGSAVGFAQIAESARQFDIEQALRERQFTEDVRQFGLDEAFRRDQLRQQGVQFDEDLAFRRESLGESARQFDEQLGFNREELAERARATNLNAAVNVRGQDFTLAPQMGQLALDQSRFMADVLRNPSDWIARAAMQRGEASPQPFVSHADIINNLRRDVQNTNNFLKEQAMFRASLPSAPVGFTAAPVVAAPTTTAPRTHDLGVASPAEPASQAQMQHAVQQSQNLAGQGTAVFAGTEGGLWEFNPDTQQFVEHSPVGSFEGGGFTEGMAVVGERGPELAVAVPGGGFAVMNQEQLGFNPKELLPSKKQGKGKPVRGMQLGGFQEAMNRAPELPNLPEQNQSDIVSLANRNLAPAVRDVFSGDGGTPAPLRFGFRMPTMRQLNSLTPAEQQAANTWLGVVHNTTLEDVGFNAGQLFNPTRQMSMATRQF